MLRIFANSLVAYFFYTRAFILIFFMWDYLLLFLCAGDVAKSGAFDSHI